VHGLCKVLYNMCFNSINKKINKQIKNLLFVTESITWKNKNKAFMNVFDITKKCYKLARMDGIKT
jgi:hypothetical protein